MEVRCCSRRLLAHKGHAIPEQQLSTQPLPMGSFSCPPGVGSGIGLGYLHTERQGNTSRGDRSKGRRVHGFGGLTSRDSSSLTFPLFHMEQKPLSWYQLLTVLLKQFAYSCAAYNVPGLINKIDGGADFAAFFDYSCNFHDVRMQCILLMASASRCSAAEPALEYLRVMAVDHSTAACMLCNHCLP